MTSFVDTSTTTFTLVLSEKETRWGDGSTEFDREKRWCRRGCCETCSLDEDEARAEADDGMDRGRLRSPGKSMMRSSIAIVVFADDVDLFASAGETSKAGGRLVCERETLVGPSQSVGPPVPSIPRLFMHTRIIVRVVVFALPVAEELGFPEFSHDSIKVSLPDMSSALANYEEHGPERTLKGTHTGSKKRHHHRFATLPAMRHSTIRTSGSFRSCRYRQALALKRHDVRTRCRMRRLGITNYLALGPD
ncbi:hypothetical protein THAOC_03529 [Thalassiosira oceanica]|uniref:Uncharacterized protein n=1 Tax=Thalassiosira oceanica TaxID=159749 RepID=K0TKU8_THAOC|nr:hypothetical protein THAOC_03529 [Thalassiosira oceanica]|eukprot:EJK74776.1 hypothetical protein THAOC_03529 [Thalassiosira oceanica]